MTKIIEIIKAYWNYLMKPKNKTLSEERLNVCTPCTFNSTKGFINKHSKCTSCGCWITIKANNKSSQCPANKWKN